MKKFSLIFAAFIYGGGFTDLDNAANACSPGSGKLFEERNNEALGDHVGFTDANGDEASIVPGDAVQPVYESGAFKGYLAVDATVVATWNPIVEDATAASATTATAATDTAAAAGGGSAS